jgi:hypothetical protein
MVTVIFLSLKEISMLPTSLKPEISSDPPSSSAKRDIDMGEVTDAAIFSLLSSPGFS